MNRMGLFISPWRHLMKVKEFVRLINSLDCEEFSDVPENDVELVKSRVNEVWSFDDTYSTSMNVYKCEDGYAGVIGVSHINDRYFSRNRDALCRLPHCIAVEVVEVSLPTFAPNPNNIFVESKFYL